MSLQGPRSSPVSVALLERNLKGSWVKRTTAWSESSRSSSEAALAPAPLPFAALELISDRSLIEESGDLSVVASISHRQYKVISVTSLPSSGTIQQQMKRHHGLEITVQDLDHNCRALFEYPQYYMLSCNAYDYQKQKQKDVLSCIESWKYPQMS
jgi:hypothetical protein